MIKTKKISSALLILLLFALTQCNNSSKHESQTNASGQGNNAIVSKDTIETIPPPDLKKISNKSLNTLTQMIKNMVYVEHGDFMIGNDGNANTKPIHKVFVKDFYINKYEVTQEEWEAIMGDNPSVFTHRNKVGDVGTPYPYCPNCPVECVQWDAVLLFTKKLSQLSGLSFRLPTEEEWEYAARGGNKSKGYTYSGSNDASEVGWLFENSAIANPTIGGMVSATKRTHPVGSKKPNELGLYDMTGNLSELCSSFYKLSYGTDNNMTSEWGLPLNVTRVNRGGNWNSDSDKSHIYNRDITKIKLDANNMVGLRLVVDNLTKERVDALQIEYTSRMKSLDSLAKGGSKDIEGD
jgi:formylglycine-generating enzyme required for sulfatase activity